MQSQSEHAPIIVTDEEWSNRHLQDESWIEGYWKSRNHPHRSFITETIQKFSPIHSVLEIGCASGPNLYRIARKFPCADVRGIDINPMAVQLGNEWFRQEGLSNVELEVGKAQNLKRFRDKSFDVVLTDAVLIYVPPDEIRQVAREMLRIGRVLVLNEWHIFNKRLALFWNTYCCLKMKTEIQAKQRFTNTNFSLIPQSSLGFFVGHWARDYKTLFQKFVQKEKVHITKLPKKLYDDKGWQTWGAIIEVKGQNITDSRTVAHP
ncbi:MAG: class I SAM-dependent methyltransferase [Candidatus Bathyarchaeia archaeon]|jgi:ubiquinone/menaquinone biosynthesis C-methylase UbiE